ncbi:MAG: T9SS type A sorting domain-containing protein [Bacteroidales bacterium]|nr:T9SS type A sorting domain-containing protein [Bacteroidales bacterium]
MKTIITILVLLIFGNISNAQVFDSLWYKAYGGNEHDRGFTVMEDDDGIFLVAGSTASYTNGGSDAYLIKLDNNGNAIWEKSYGGAMDEHIASICPALYDGYMLTGYTKTDAEGISDIWVLWVSEEGDSLHSVHHGGLTTDQAFKIIPNIDQGYTITSSSSVYMMGDQVYLLKLDLSLDTIWTKMYGYDKQDYGHDIIQTSSGDYIVAGRTYSTVYPESGQAWVIKTDSNGDSLWTKKYGGNDEDIFYAVVETEDGYMFAGQTRSFNAVIIDVLVVHTDYDGNVIWSKIYGGNNADYAYGIFRTEDDDYVITGYSKSFNENNDVYVLKIDGDGEVLFQGNFGVAEDAERMYGSYLTSDGGLIATGILDYYWQLQDDMFVLKLGPDENGFEEMGFSNDHSFYNYPNPFSDVTTFHFNASQNSRVELSIFDAYGKQVKTVFKKQVSNSKQDIQVDCSDLCPGIYYCELKTENQIQVRKIVIAR